MVPSYLWTWSGRTVNGRTRASKLKVGPWIFVLAEESMADEGSNYAMHIWPECHVVPVSKSK